MNDDELSKVIGANVRAAREAAELTQSQLSERTGIAVPHISRLEAGTHPPNLKTVNKVANALGIEAAELLKPPKKPRKS